MKLAKAVYDIFPAAGRMFVRLPIDLPCIRPAQGVEIARGVETHFHSLPLPVWRGSLGVALMLCLFAG